MATRANPRDLRRTRSRSSGRSRRPERVRSTGTARARVREGVRSKRLAGAARALGLSSTRRAAVAALVVCALAFTLAVPLRTYLAQRAEVSEQEELKQQLTERVAELERKKAELADPAQVEAEARRRLRYVMPGEKPYIVQLPGDSATEEARTAAERAKASQAWFEQLWSSVTG
jgi:cell division protein FtsB